MQKVVNLFHHWNTVRLSRQRNAAMQKHGLVPASKLVDYNIALADQQILQSIRYEMMERNKSVTAKHKVICNLLGIKDLPKKTHPTNNKGRRK